MGLIDDLEYRPPRQNVFQQTVTAFAGTRPGARLLSLVHEPVDRAWRRLSGGSYATNVLAGLSVVELTTTGAKSGRPRTVSLIPVPFERDLAVLGTNYGQRNTPGWVYNLESEPRANLTHRSLTVEVVARRADPSQTDQVFEVASQVYVGYASYRSRAAHRDIRVFILERAD